MAEAIPQLESAADADAGMGAETSVNGHATDTTSGGAPQGAQPRAMTQEDRSFQARYDKLVNQVGRLTNSEYLRTLGGDGIVRALEQFEAILSHPDTAKSVKDNLIQSADGKWQYRPTAQQRAAEVDAAAGMIDAEDPLLKQIESRVEQRLGPIMEQLNSLRARNDAALTASGAQKVADLTRQFLAEYPLSPEERASFAEKIRPEIEGLDPSVVLRLNYAQFKRHVGLPNVEEFLPAVLARKAKQRGSQLSDLATDASGAGSFGADSAPVAKPVAKPWDQLKRELAAAAERAAREPA